MWHDAGGGLPTTWLRLTIQRFPHKTAKARYLANPRKFASPKESKHSVARTIDVRGHCAMSAFHIMSFQRRQNGIVINPLVVSLDRKDVQAMHIFQDKG